MPRTQTVTRWFLIYQPWTDDAYSIKLGGTDILSTFLLT